MIFQTSVFSFQSALQKAKASFCICQMFVAESGITNLLSSEPHKANKCRDTQTQTEGWDGMGRDLGGGFRMGNTCIPTADSGQMYGKTNTML